MPQPEMKSRRLEIIAQKRAGRAIARVRLEASSLPYLGFASPPLLLNHLLFEGKICFIREKKNKTKHHLSGWFALRCV